MKNEKNLAWSFYYTFRYKDDFLSQNNSKFGESDDGIYPTELIINYATCTVRSILYLEKQLFTTKEMFSIFSLWTFHLYVATFQQHLYMEFIILSWSDCLRLLVPNLISLLEACWYQGGYRTMGCYWLSWSHHFEYVTVATMTRLIATEYLSHKWPHTCSVFRNTNPVLATFMTYPRIRNTNNTTSTTCGARTAYPVWTLTFLPVVLHVLVISGIRVVYCV